MEYKPRFEDSELLKSHSNVIYLRHFIFEKRIKFEAIVVSNGTVQTFNNMNHKFTNYNGKLYRSKNVSLKRFLTLNKDKAVVLQSSNPLIFCEEELDLVPLFDNVHLYEWVERLDLKNLVPQTVGFEP